jgi:hypothetical protein
MQTKTTWLTITIQHDAMLTFSSPSGSAELAYEKLEITPHGKVVIDPANSPGIRTAAGDSKQTSSSRTTHSLCDMWERSQLSLLEIRLEFDVKGKIGLSPICGLQPGKYDQLPVAHWLSVVPF